VIGFLSFLAQLSQKFICIRNQSIYFNSSENHGEKQKLLAEKMARRSFYSAPNNGKSRCGVPSRRDCVTDLQ
jgi:hypothetical protein